ncbi:MAG: GMP reductase [Candidatus Thiodiazotropha taylori]|uniref:GMP reductase n=1 Tax=Candidatus Thiodiazotropha taylori TaxID=2792791 RepID=A0A9E4KAG1_9GAMM|nr:GMP reductase [Candidatus Thiodiazotropha taylori]MCW4255091.1 GMP reductase [Candidatus Thiodiazotropha taylori]
MRIENEILLDYSDVLIKPKKSSVGSRSKVDLTRTFKFQTGTEWTGTPIMAANMDTVGTVEVAAVLENKNMFTCLHKYYDVEALFGYFLSGDRNNTAYTMGITENDYNKWNNLKHKLPNGKIKYVCIDVANGYMNKFSDFVKKFKDENPDVTLIAGNVVTPEQTQELVNNGVDIVKVGIGPGSVCTTRLVTGVGYPQLSAVINCADAAHGLGGYIIADGGCCCPGDVAKAFGAGADFVMLGGMLAGHEENGGETVMREGEMFKSFYGMSSKKANDLYNNGMDNYKASEGREVLVPFKGKLEDTLQEITGGLASACSYTCSDSISDLFNRTTFIRVNNQYNKTFEG